MLCNGIIATHGGKVTSLFVQVTNILNAAEIILIPFVNPDGYVVRITSLIIN